MDTEERRKALNDLHIFIAREFTHLEGSGRMDPRGWQDAGVTVDDWYGPPSTRPAMAMFP